MYWDEMNKEQRQALIDKLENIATDLTDMGEHRLAEKLKNLAYRLESKILI